MEDLLKRLELLEKYCSEEYNDLYYKLLKCKDKAIQMSYEIRRASCRERV